MNFLFLILWKIINLTRLEVFDLCQLEHLLESCVTIGEFLTQEKFNKGGCWHGFVGLELLWPKRAKLWQLPSFYNFASSQTSPKVQQDI
jgi:hypothetical protein